MTDLADPPRPRAAATVPAANAAHRSVRQRWHRFWRRKPFHRSMVLAHRWPALVLGLLLVVETTAGSVLLYKPELTRLTHPAWFSHSAELPTGADDAAGTLSAMEAVDVVAQAHPDADLWGAYADQGVWAVVDTGWTRLWFVDPGSGDINGTAATDDGVLDALVNLHDCAFSCEGYPGYQSWMAAPVWSGAPGGLADVTWTVVVLGGLGLLLLALALTSLRIWWPGIKRLRSRFTVRTGKGRFARDYDLHNVVGAVALPFLLMWGLTGAAFEIPAVKTAWVQLTGGDTPREEEWALERAHVPDGTPPTTAEQAVATALRDVPGEVTGVYQPVKDSDFWEVDVISSWRSFAGTGGSDTYVLVDPGTPDHFVTLYSARGEPLANRVYDKVIEPAHFGGQASSWWRAIWFAMGLAPLVLMVTGISTWLFRRGTRRRRAAAKAARA
ncbi:PepSY domain-containing protein [Cellulomonas sp. HZM]|uniref:PepSY-associated TM helix domain-containing protein n=1 Tax=Cellulomonas sp. HZM TaxID=1454010 RepID=UPI0006915455|nr:PepSY-associated TM helix domain-containing protein [Cellulomonas sp. HZM]